MRTDQITAMLDGGYFAVQEQYLQTLINTINAGALSKTETDSSVSPSHSYSVVGDVAVISIDGVMIKKNTSINALCGGFVAYDTIEGYITKAENDDKVKKVVFRVDTRGGDVLGVDNLGERIYDLKKPTLTYYDNIGASAGVWAFSASDGLYASKITNVGSIGVLTTYIDKKKEDKSISNKVMLMSHNAENKVCTLSKDCKDKAQSKIDEYESVFLERVSRNTGMSPEEIVQGFDKGGVLIADKAESIGFLDGVMSFDRFMKEVATMPSDLEKIATKKNDKGGNSMAVTEKDLEEVQGLLREAEETIQSKEKELAARPTSEDVDAAVTVAVKEEQERAASCLSAIPKAYWGTESIMALVGDGKSTPVDVKAALFDLRESKEAVIANDVIDGGVSTTKAAASIDTSSDEETSSEDKEAAEAIALAKQMEGE